MNNEDVKDEIKEFEKETEKKELEEKEDEKEEPEQKPKEDLSKDKEGSFRPIFIIMLASLLIAFYWDKLAFIKDAVHFVLNPTAGALLSWNLNLGMLIIVIIITIITTLVQKYATDQKTLKELKSESKEIQKQMKEFKNHPEKMMDLQKRQLALFPKQMKLSMRGIAYTGIPFILFFRWFNDYFAVMGNPRFIFGLSWFLFYLITAIIISSVLRKYMDVV